MTAPTTFEKLEKQKPLMKEVEIAMVANSTTAVQTEIDTDIAAGSKIGWHIIGFDFLFFNPASPYERKAVRDGSNSYMATLQLNRGEAPATAAILAPTDGDILIERSWGRHVASGVGFETEPRTYPDFVPAPDGIALTQLPKLHAVFETSADVAEISDALVSILMRIFYYQIDAPQAPRERV